MTPELEFALEAASEAGKITLEYFGQKTLKVDRKRDSTPVTQADRNAEKKIRELAKKKFPKDGLLGEEFGEKASKNGRKWIMDPIDGTKSFIHGVPLYGVMLGLEVGGQMHLGVIQFPALGLTYYAEKGCGAYCNLRRISTSAISSLADATLTFTGGEYFTQKRTKHPFDKLHEKAGLLRGWGDCYGHMLVASGQAEITADPEMSPWDCAAIIPIIEEAGGQCFDYTGKTTIYGKGLVSTNGPLGKELLQWLKKEVK
ncbi:MAG: histidinol-phosphatase [Chlorobiales bacterium]|nr:histidinol-phosphatase [Chlorobiales bacterium]